ncbi:hypothetical protein BCF74_12618 [Knoellia remsis]|uniref:Uncharacterized protein n=1 Tax=Knoellia remsis TaxID=407159 RepID=A0A2T0U7W5_9MICO|nr:hypothetical protein [Knoellia remsis]PRY54004.1 hypothetical protein BCF74_12618 [Knoellia remsis]
MDITILHRINADIAASLTEASRGDLDRPTAAGGSVLEVLEGFAAEQRRVLGVLEVAAPDGDASVGDALLGGVSQNGEDFGDLLAADVRARARLVEVALAEASGSAAASLHAEHTMAAIEACRQLERALGLD